MYKEDVAEDARSVMTYFSRYDLAVSFEICTSKSFAPLEFRVIMTLLRRSISCCLGAAYEIQVLRSMAICDGFDKNITVFAKQF